MICASGRFERVKTAGGDFVKPDERRKRSIFALYQKERIVSLPGQFDIEVLLRRLIDSAFGRPSLGFKDDSAISR
jgi:hypothetical protein